MTMHSIDDILSHALDYAVEGLREAHQRAPRNGRETVYDIAGIISFAGPLRGSLVVMSNMGAVPDRLTVRDWAGELTKKVARRIESRLFERGISFEASAPVVVWGPTFESEAYRSPDPDARLLTARRGAVGVRWNVWASKAAERAADAPLGTVASAAEASLMFF